MPADGEGTRPPRVTVNVVAFDGHGDPVGDLTAGDFEIQDQGRRQRIVHFRRNEGRPRLLPAAGHHEYSNRSETSVQQAAVIVLDLLNGNMTDRGSGWEGINSALEHIESANNLYLYILTAEAKMFPVHGLPDPEVDAAPQQQAAQQEAWTQQIRALLDAAIRTVNRLKPLNDREPVQRVRATYQALGMLTTQLAAIPGRKSVVWITRGVSLTIPLANGDLIDLTEPVRKYATTLNRAGIAMYSVDHSGALGNSHDALEQLADLTGGRAYPGNNVEMAIPAAIVSAQGSYLIQYEPPPDNWDGKLHRIKVNSTRKGIRLQSQQGYYAYPPPPGEDPMRTAFDAAAANPFDASGIGLRTTVSLKPDTPHTVHFEIRIDPAGLQFVQQGDRQNCRLAIGFVGIVDKRLKSVEPVQVNVGLSKEQFELGMKSGIPLIHDEAVADGVRKIRIVLLDLGSGETGTLTVPTPTPGSR